MLASRAVVSGCVGCCKGVFLWNQYLFCEKLVVRLLNLPRSFKKAGGSYLDPNKGRMLKAGIPSEKQLALKKETTMRRIYRGL